MSKRTSTSVMPASKKVKVIDPVVAKIEQVVAAFEAGNIPTETFDVISQAIPHCLGVVREERHRFQEEAVEMIERQLKMFEARFEQNIKIAEAVKQESAQKVSSMIAELERLYEGLDKRKQEMKHSKSVLAGDARTFQKTKSARSEELAKQESGLREISKAVASKETIEGFMKEIETIHASEDRSVACSTFITNLSKQVNIDDSMKTAIPSALAKSVDSRGSFDVMVIKQLNALIATRFEELSTQITNAEPIRTALEADVAKAEKEHQAAKAKQMESAQLFIESQAIVSGEEENIKSMQKDLKCSRNQDKKACDGLNDNRYNLDIFKSGPLDAFVFLQERAEAPTQSQDEVMEISPAEDTPIAIETSVETAVVAC